MPCIDPSHRCRACDPGLSPVGPPAHEGHIGVRLGTRLRDGRRLLIDGHDVTDAAYEAMLGQNGTVWLYVLHGPHGKVRHCGSACAEIRRGNVQIQEPE